MSALLNIGCGEVFHAAWVNIDAAPTAPEVMAHDVRAGLPFADHRFDGIYASHVLEHLDPEGGLRLLRECHRVLRPNGVARIAVPDLEAIARTYLQSLDEARRGDPQAEERYDWMMLELYDQVSRTSSGGQMAERIARPGSETQRRFIEGRIGKPVVQPPRSRAALSSARRAARNARARAAEACAFGLLGAEGAAALREGLFRRGGEVHQWMYDRFSLGRALARAGFVDIIQRAADESAIAGFAGYGLEIVDGRPRKPDSLYMEARKPG